MDYVQTLGKVIQDQLADLQKQGGLPADLDLQNVSVVVPRLEEHGDLATNAAFIISRQLGVKPMDVADRLMNALRKIDLVTEVTFVEPGFINLKLHQSFWYDLLKQVLQMKEDYGSSNLGQGIKVNVEYVSANPTGPLHIAHLRGGVYGDVLANAMSKCGYQVDKEYYSNDRGSQVEAMARSVFHRYKELLGHSMGEIPAGLYPGEYLIDVAKQIQAQEGDKWDNEKEEKWLPYFVNFSINAILEIIKEDLHAVGIYHKIFRSERALHNEGNVFDESIKNLQEQGLLYKGTLKAPKTAKASEWQQREQLLFRSTAYGDDEDRALTKSSGDWTYLASDIAYAYDKIQRGYKLLIYVLGADHHSYVKPIEALTLALSQEHCRAEVPLCQIVHLKNKGQTLKFSKRQGNIYTIKELIKEIGKDAARMVMLMRSHTLQIEFDIETLKEESKDNPVFYLHYAYARCCSVQRMAENAFPDLAKVDPSKADLQKLVQPEEISLIKIIGQWPSILKGSVEKREPHLITFYLKDLAAAWHAFWTKGKRNEHLRMVVPANHDLTQAHLALAKAVAYTLASGMQILGLDTPETM